MASQPSSITLTRAELYDRIWTTAVIKVAHEFGISDVGLAKICRKHDIPRPPLGYWARLAAGQRPKKAKLPRPDDKSTITITPYHLPPGNWVSVGDAAEKEPEGPPIIVPAALRKPHALVALTQQTLTAAAPDYNGWLHVSDASCLDLRVSKEGLARALRLMEGLIRGLEKQDCQVVVAGEQYNKQTIIKCMDVDVTLKITERMESRTKEEPPRKAVPGRYEFSHSQFTRELVATNEFTLKLDTKEHAWEFADRIRKKFKDTKRQKLEDILHKVAQSIRGLAQAVLNQRRAHEEAEKRREEAAAREAAAEKVRAQMWAKIEAEQRKVDALLADASTWTKSQQLRLYLATVRRNAEAEGKTIDPGSEFGLWLEWAEQQADRLDPLTKSPASILDQKSKYKPTENSSSW